MPEMSPQSTASVIIKVPVPTPVSRGQPAQAAPQPAPAPPPPPPPPPNPFRPVAQPPAHVILPYAATGEAAARLARAAPRRLTGGESGLQPTRPLHPPRPASVVIRPPSHRGESLLMQSTNRQPVHVLGGPRAEPPPRTPGQVISNAGGAGAVPPGAPIDASPFLANFAETSARAGRLALPTHARVLGDSLATFGDPRAAFAHLHATALENLHPPITGGARGFAHYHDGTALEVRRGPVSFVAGRPQHWQFPAGAEAWSLHWHTPQGTFGGLVPRGEVAGYLAHLDPAQRAQLAGQPPPPPQAAAPTRQGLLARLRSRLRLAREGTPLRLARPALPPDHHVTRAIGDWLWGDAENPAANPPGGLHNLALGHLPSTVGMIAFHASGGYSGTVHPHLPGRIRQLAGAMAKEPWMWQPSPAGPTGLLTEVRRRYPALAAHANGILAAMGHPTPSASAYLHLHREGLTPPDAAALSSLYDALSEHGPVSRTAQGLSGTTVGGAALHNRLLLALRHHLGDAAPPAWPGRARFARPFDAAEHPREGAPPDPGYQPGEFAPKGKGLLHKAGAPLRAAQRLVAVALKRVEARYGPGAAKAVKWAMILGQPIPLPLASVMMAGPVIAAAELRRQIFGPPERKARGDATEQSLQGALARDPRDLAARNAYADLLREHGDESAAEQMLGHYADGLWPSEQARLEGFGGRASDAYSKALSTALRNRPGLLPTLREVHAVAGVGASARGEYAHAFRTLSELLGPPMAHAFAAINALYSSRASVAGHTAAALKTLADWQEAGRPTRGRALLAVMAKQPRHVVFGHKVPGAIALLQKLGRQGSYLYDPHDVTQSGMGKTANFGAAFPFGSGAPIDVHMLRLSTPPLLTPRRVRALAASDPETYREFALHAENLMADAPTFLAYKQLLAHAAAETGWTTSEAQEAVWTGILGIMAAKHLAAGRGHDMERYLRHEALSQGWDMHDLLFNEENRDALKRLGHTDRTIAAAARRVAARRQAAPAPRAGAALPGDPGSLASAAARLPAAGGPSVARVRRVMEQFRRRGELRRLALHPEWGGDFAAALAAADGTARLPAVLHHYADHLEAAGKPTVAGFLRRAAEGGWSRTVLDGGSTPPGQFRLYLYHHPEGHTVYRMALMEGFPHPTDEGGPADLTYHLAEVPARHALQIAHRLAAEGVTLHPAAVEHYRRLHYHLTGLPARLGPFKLARLGPARFAGFVPSPNAAVRPLPRFDGFHQAHLRRVAPQGPSPDPAAHAAYGRFLLSRGEPLGHVVLHSARAGWADPRGEFKGLVYQPLHVLLHEGRAGDGVLAFGLGRLRRPDGQTAYGPAVDYQTPAWDQYGHSGIHYTAPLTGNPLRLLLESLRPDHRDMMVERLAEYSRMVGDRGKLRYARAAAAGAARARLARLLSRGGRRMAAQQPVHEPPTHYELRPLDPWNYRDVHAVPTVGAAISHPKMRGFSHRIHAVYSDGSSRPLTPATDPRRTGVFGPPNERGYRPWYGPNTQAPPSLARHAEGEPHLERDRLLMALADLTHPERVAYQSKGAEFNDWRKGRAGAELARLRNEAIANDSLAHYGVVADYLDEAGPVGQKVAAEVRQLLDQGRASGVVRFARPFPARALLPAHVSYTPGSGGPPELVPLLTRAFGRMPRWADLDAIGRVLPGGRLRVTPAGHGLTGVGLFSALGHVQSAFTHVIRHPHTGVLQVINQHLDNAPESPVRGHEILARQAAAAARLGLGRIELPVAAGGPHDPAHSGYYAWPRLGFDGPLPSGVYPPPELAGAKTFHQLFALPGGPEWWKANGGDAFGLHFDVRPGSPHWQRLEAYVRTRKGSA